jgi:hypothetical protein
MENDAESLMQNNMALESGTMSDMEEGAAEDYARSFEPEAPSEPAYQPQQQPYGGEYDQYVEDQAEAMEPPPQQMAQQPLAFKDVSSMASAIADSMVTDEGAAYVGPRLYNTFSQYTTAQEMYDSEEKQAAIKAANRQITKELTQMGIMLFADLMPKTMPMMVQDGIEQSGAAGEREMAQYASAREQVAQEYPELTRMGPQELDQIADEYANATGRSIEDEQFYNPRTGRPLGPAKNAQAQYRHVMSWWRGSGYPTLGRARDDLDGEMSELVYALGNRRGLV